MQRACLCDGLCAAFNAELAKEMTDVFLDCRDADRELDTRNAMYSLAGNNYNAI